jgi:hypothetical protein
MLDLSHPEIFFFSMRSLVPRAACLVSLVRGGMVPKQRSRRCSRREKVRAMIVENGVCGAEGEK